MTYILKNWSLVEDQSNPYRAPELRRKKLQGNVYGHPGFSDGEQVVTSTPVWAEGRRVRTHSGSEYFLEGPADPAFKQFLVEGKYEPLDEEHPFKNLEDK